MPTDHNFYSMNFQLRHCVSEYFYCAYVIIIECINICMCISMLFHLTQRVAGVFFSFSQSVSPLMSCYKPLHKILETVDNKDIVCRCVFLKTLVQMCILPGNFHQNFASLKLTLFCEFNAQHTTCLVMQDVRLVTVP